MTITRKEFLKLLGGGAVFLSILKLISFIPPIKSKNVVRPPGAVEDPYFNNLCIRCGICLEVCPTKTIVFTGFENGPASIDTPKIDPLIGPCEFYQGRCEEDIRCCRYCPTGALQPVQKEQVKLGSVEFTPTICLAYIGKECIVCKEMCPIPDAITVTEDLKPVFHDDQCIGCGTCVYSCPTDPKALKLIPKGTKRPKWRA